MNDSNSISGIKGAHTNINGIGQKINAVTFKLSDQDIICIAETKFSHDFETCKLEIDGYKEPYCKDRDINNEGGLMIHVKFTAPGGKI